MNSELTSTQAQLNSAKLSANGGAAGAHDRERPDLYPAGTGDERSSQAFFPRRHRLPTSRFSWTP